MTSNCPQIPSVTIYGTTQISTTVQTLSTWTSVYLGAPIVSTTTETEISDCSANDAFDNDGITCQTRTNTALVTVTPTLTTTLSTTVTQQTVITSVVPQKTLYSACPNDAGPDQTLATNTLDLIQQHTTPVTSSSQAVPTTLTTKPTTTTTTTPTSTPTTTPTTTSTDGSDTTQTNQGDSSQSSSTDPDQENTSSPSSSVTNQDGSSSTSIIHQQTSSSSHSSSADHTNTNSKQTSNLATLSLATTPIAASGTSSPTAPLSIGSISQSEEIPSLDSASPAITASDISNTNTETDPNAVPTIAASLINPNDSNSTSVPQHSSSRHSSGKIAGGVVGSLLGLVLLCVVLAFWRRRRQEKRSQGGSEVDYWERRFRDLEDPDRESGSGHTDAGDGDGDGEKGMMGNDQARRKERTRKLHLTLNLDSDKISDRPTSALSAISSFFSSRPQPEAAHHRGGNLNFSGPMVRVPSSSGESTDSPPRNERTRTSLKRISRFFGLGSSGLSDSSPRGKSMRRDEEAGEGRGMEWVRTIVDGDSAAHGNQKDGEREGMSSWMGSTIIDTAASSHSGSSSSRKSRQVRNSTSQSRPTSSKPPPESDSNSPFRPTPLEGRFDLPTPSTDREGYLNRLQNAEAVVSSPHSSTRLLTRVPVPASTTLDKDGLHPPTASRNPSKRAKAPDLKLSQAATTPSLWVNDELDSQFHPHTDTEKGKAQPHVVSPKLPFIAVSAFSAESVLSDDETVSSSRTSSITSEAPLTESFVDRSSRITESDRIKVTETERSAVTPQLPVVQLAGSPAWGLEGWGVDTRRD